MQHSSIQKTIPCQKPICTHVFQYKILFRTEDSSWFQTEDSSVRKTLWYAKLSRVKGSSERKTIPCGRAFRMQDALASRLLGMKGSCEGKHPPYKRAFWFKNSAVCESFVRTILIHEMCLSNKWLILNRSKLRRTTILAGLTVFLFHWRSVPGLSTSAVRRLRYGLSCLGKLSETLLQLLHESIRRAVGSSLRIHSKLSEPLRAMSEALHKDFETSTRDLGEFSKSYPNSGRYLGELAEVLTELSGHPPRAC